MGKLRVIQDYEKLPEELKEQIKLVFPEGFSNHLIEFRNRHGELVSALPFETDEKIYMIRMSVKMAERIISEDSDYDEDGLLKDEIKEKYQDEYADLEYLADNENYDDESDE